MVLGCTVVNDSFDSLGMVQKCFFVGCWFLKAAKDRLSSEESCTHGTGIAGTLVLMSSAWSWL